MVHADLTEGIGKDNADILYLSECGVDGMISTRANIIRIAENNGLIAIQRVFVLDSKGVDSIEVMIGNSIPHLVDIMPDVVYKAISRFSSGVVSIIAVGLVETKQEVITAFSCGAERLLHAVDLFGMSDK